MTAFSISFGSLSLTYTSSSACAARLLDFAFLNQNVAQADEALPTIEMTEEPSGELVLRQAGEAETRSASPGNMALALIERATFHLADRCMDGPVVHAGCVSRDGQGILLPGGTGSGKTCLTTWLLTQGWDYLTDELALLQPGLTAPTCQGLARPLNIKSSARSLFPDLTGHPDSLATPFGHLIRPETAQAQANPSGQVLREIHLSQIVFPTYLPDAPLDFVPLPKAKAVFLLMQGLINARNLSDHGLPAVSAICQSVPAYRLQYGSFDQIAGFDFRI